MDYEKDVLGRIYPNIKKRTGFKSAVEDALVVAVDEAEKWKSLYEAINAPRNPADPIE